MLKRSRFTLITAFLMLFFPILQAAENAQAAREWLGRMANAIRTLNYEGYFIYSHDGQLEAMKIVHSADSDGEHERLQSLTGAAREILRDNDLLTCILPDSESVIVEKSRPRKYIPEALLKDTSPLEKFYEFRVGGKDRMAGRVAQRIAVKPKDRYRYGYRLWLDWQTGMLLKSDLVNDKGKAIEQVMFVTLNVMDSIPDKKLAASIDGKNYKHFKADVNQKKSAVPGGSPWQVTRMPEGYFVSMQRKHAMPTGKGRVEHMVLTDGLSSVSVFVEKRDRKQEALKGLSSMGAINAFGMEVSGHYVTVVGEVPKATVSMIGESIRMVSEVDQP